MTFLKFPFFTKENCNSLHFNRVGIIHNFELCFRVFYYVHRTSGYVLMVRTIDNGLGTLIQQALDTEASDRNLGS